MQTTTIGHYSVFFSQNKSYWEEDHIKGAAVHEKLESEEGEYIFYGISESPLLSDLVIEGRYSPDSSAHFLPSIMLLPEHSLMFFGAGETIQIWQLHPYKKIDEHTTAVGFWYWYRHKDIVLLVAELELTAFNTQGKKLWSKLVEPPWSFDIEDDVVTSTVMDVKESFDIYTGEPKEAAQ